MYTGVLAASGQLSRWPDFSVVGLLGPVRDTLSSWPPSELLVVLAIVVSLIVARIVTGGPPAEDGGLLRLLQLVYAALFSFCILALIFATVHAVGNVAGEPKHAGVASKGIDSFKALAEKELTITLVAEQLKLPEKKLIGHLRITAPYRIEDELFFHEYPTVGHGTLKRRPPQPGGPKHGASKRASSSAQRIFACTNSGCTLKTRYQKLEIVLASFGLSPSGGLTALPLTQHLLVSDLFKPPSAPLSRYNEIDVPFSYPGQGNSRAYPADSYTFNNAVVPETSSQLSPQLPNQPTIFEGNSVLRVTYLFDAGPLADSLNVRISSIAAGSFYYWPQQGIYQIHVSRYFDGQAYVFTVASVPIILAVLLSHVLFLNRRYRDLDFPEFLAALAAAILAVLPLHVILVPMDIPDLTSVDVVLGMGLAGITVVALLKYAVSMRTASGHGGRDGGERSLPTPPRALPPGKGQSISRRAATRIQRSRTRMRRGRARP